MSPPALHGQKPKRVSRALNTRSLECERNHFVFRCLFHNAHVPTHPIVQPIQTRVRKTDRAPHFGATLLSEEARARSREKESPWVRKKILCEAPTEQRVPPQTVLRSRPVLLKYAPRLRERPGHAHGFYDQTRHQILLQEHRFHHGETSRDDDYEA